MSHNRNVSAGPSPTPSSNRSFLCFGFSLMRCSVWRMRTPNSDPPGAFCSPYMVLLQLTFIVYLPHCSNEMCYTIERTMGVKLVAFVGLFHAMASDTPSLHRLNPKTAPYSLWISLQIMSKRAMQMCPATIPLLRQSPWVMFLLSYFVIIRCPACLFGVSSQGCQPNVAARPVSVSEPPQRTAQHCLGMQTVLSAPRSLSNGV